MKKSEYKQYFPYPKIRKQQEQVLDFIIKNLKKRFFVLECPPGTGKSAIAITISKWIVDNFPVEDCQPGSYILTTQKILQSQYFDDFEDVSNIWSKSNYKCLNEDLKNASCQSGLMLSKLLGKRSSCEDKCPYIREKKKFINGPVSITNVSFMLNQLVYGKEIPRRQLLVVDECHNIEQSIIDFVSVNINKKFCENELEIDYPEDIKNTDDLYHWIQKHYLKNMSSCLENISNYAVSLDQKDDSNELKSILHKIEEYDRMICQTNRFIDNYDENWVLAQSEDFYEVKPIYASKFNHYFNICNKILMMSATILDHSTFCRNVGIKEEEACFMSLPSPFLKKNRPVYIAPVGSMSAAKIESTLPDMNAVIQQLLKEHSGEKGIIHTHTYKTAKYFKDNDKTGRLLLHDSKNRDEIIQTHYKSKKNTVLISPSLTEGIDLRNDYSRFQIICKIPFPYLGDKYVKTKMEKCKYWYEWQTAKTLIQALGRSIRSEEDYAVSYILDSSWDFFFKKNNFMFPEWFKDSLIKV
jgi:Rad3-related DNA helicase